MSLELIMYLIIFGAVWLLACAHVGFAWLFKKPIGFEEVSLAIIVAPVSPFFMVGYFTYLIYEAINNPFKQHHNNVFPYGMSNSHENGYSDLEKIKNDYYYINRFNAIYSKAYPILKSEKLLPFIGRSPTHDEAVFSLRQLINKHQIMALHTDKRSFLSRLPLDLLPIIVQNKTCMDLQQKSLLTQEDIATIETIVARP